MKVSHSGVPEDGFSVPVCFDGDKAYVMPPFAKARFIATDDLNLGNMTDLRAALNVDYAIQALKLVEEKGGGNDQAKELVRNTITSISSRADEQVKKVIKKPIPADTSYFQIAVAYQTAQRVVQSELANSGFSDAAETAAGRTKSKRPAFWRASQLLDLVNRLRPKGTG